jgi:hypothetical protein
MTCSGRVTRVKRWRSSSVLDMAAGRLADVGIKKGFGRGERSRAKLVEEAACVSNLPAIAGSIDAIRERALERLSLHDRLSRASHAGGHERRSCTRPCMLHIAPLSFLGDLVTTQRSSLRYAAISVEDACSSRQSRVQRIEHNLNGGNARNVVCE